MTNYFKRTSKERVIMRLENAIIQINELIANDKIDKSDVFFIKQNIQVSLLYLKDKLYHKK